MKPKPIYSAQKIASDMNISPKLLKMMGVIKLPDNLNYKKNLVSH
jgi:hypothetical protein